MKLLTESEAALLLGINRNTLARYRLAGKVETALIHSKENGNRSTYLYDPEKLLTIWKKLST